MAYKALKVTRGVPGGRDAMRMMQKMGMKVDEIPDVAEVIIRTSSKDITIQAPSVTIVTVQGEAMYQIAGGQASESKPQPVVQTIPEPDVQLVAQQTGKSVDDARKALMDAGGDLAKAILSLTTQKS